MLFLTDQPIHSNNENYGGVLISLNVRQIQILLDVVKFQSKGFEIKLNVFTHGHLTNIKHNFIWWIVQAVESILVDFEFWNTILLFDSVCVNNLFVCMYFLTQIRAHSTF